MGYFSLDEDLDRKLVFRTKAVINAIYAIEDEVRTPEAFRKYVLRYCEDFMRAMGEEPATSGLRAAQQSISPTMQKALDETAAAMEKTKNPCTHDWDVKNVDCPYCAAEADGVSLK
jgi:hypothetical protein